MMQLVQLRTRRAPKKEPNALGDALERAVGDPARVLTRAIDVVAFASDASVYRLVPRAVVRPRSEADVQALFALSRARNVPLTFRAAGTSLSGQAVTDGVLVDLATGWSEVAILDEGRRVRVQPGAIGGHVNAVLRARGRRIGPDPASIDACMMGGIVANNASGMCCGVAESSYHTLDTIRVVLPSGLVIDTSDPLAGEVLRLRAPALEGGLRALRERVLADPALSARIAAKYRIKNTTGYAINALLDFERPIDILAHLLVGSEGTLGFISEVVLRTLRDAPAKRTALLLFEGAAAAFDAVAPFAESGARAIEFMDDACLRAVGGGMLALGVDVAALPAGAAALLVEYQCESQDALDALRDAERAALARVAPLFPPRFEESQERRAALWKIRKGLYPAAGATKRSGETVVIEDVAFPLARLPEATRALKALFVTHGYERALLFGHAKDGNCHFVITPSFNGPDDIARYERFMAALVELVVSHDGSLKAEHGTGRNIAPFVETEWGADAYRLMREIKTLFDPDNLLSPGVLITADPRAHVTNLKGLPTVDAEVDRCIECGFCEPVCPSRRLTTTPRQRIAIRREMVRLSGGGDPVTLASLERDFVYAGLDTCAADGMCATVCPVHIDTGSLVKRLRGEAHGPRARAMATWLARHFGALEVMMRLGVRAGHVAEWLVGASMMAAVFRVVERLLGARLPTWSTAIPRVPAQPTRAALAVARSTEAKQAAEAVFFPSCMARTMGLPRGEERSITEVVQLLADRAGVRVLVPADAPGACCGLTFGSKGYVEGHRLLVEELVDRMWTWTRGGAIPVVLDATSCLGGMLGATSLMSEAARSRFEAMRVVDLAAFVRDTLAPRLPMRRLARRVVLHPTCASRKLDEGAAMRAVAGLCATDVEVPIKLSCCGMAGDRGLMFPELNATAVSEERAEIARREGPAGHYANNLACEIGMTQASSFPYLSFVYLVEEASRTET